jgi:hypothetical protein
MPNTPQAVPRISHMHHGLLRWMTPSATLSQPAHPLGGPRAGTKLSKASELGACRLVLRRQFELNQE